jgi:hypothetical protein
MRKRIVFFGLSACLIVVGLVGLAGSASADKVGSESPIAGSSRATSGVTGQSSAAGAAGVYGVTDVAGASGVMGNNSGAQTLGSLGGASAGASGWSAGNGSSAVPAVPAGVLGVARGANAVGVYAAGAGGNATALEVYNGAIHVSGPVMPAVVVSVPSTAQVAGNAGTGQCTVSFALDHPLANADANAMLFVTSRGLDPIATSAGYAQDVTKWVIVARGSGAGRDPGKANDACKTATAQWSFNVMIVKR